MVRFNDKPQIETGSITSDDILPITDISSPEDDKKITLGQIRDFINASSEKANANLINTDMVTDSIISAPNGIFVASSSDTAITIKNGLHVVLANGRKADTKRYNVTDYILNADKTLSVVTLADNRYNVILSSGGSMYVVPTSDTYTTLKQPTSTSQTAYWFDQYNNYWKVTTNSGASWSNASIISLGEVSIANGKVTEVDPHPAISIPEFKIIENKAETDMSNLSEVGIGVIKEIASESQPNTYHPNIFEHKWSDHLLNDIQWLRGDTFSWQSGDVYVTAYDTLVAEANGQQSSFNLNNFTKVGNPTITSDGVASGFSASNYLRTINIDWSKSWLLTLKCKTPSSWNNQYETLLGMIDVAPRLRSYNGKWQLNVKGLTIIDDTETIQFNTEYWFRIRYTADQNLVFAKSTDGINYKHVGTVSGTTALTSSPLTIARYSDSYTDRYWTGSIDLKSVSITVNNVEVFSGANVTEGGVTYKQSANGFKIAQANQEQAILNKYNTDGIAWYYILDTANKRFKLPRTKFGFEGLRTNVGSDIAESLPNITGRVGGAKADWIAEGAFYRTTIGGGNVNTQAQQFYDTYFDASRSSSTYQNNAPVQERGTQMYLYFYVGEYAREAIEQTAGLNAELFNGKADVNTPSIQAPYLKTTYVNGTSGYNIWSNGYCEQWGALSNISVTWTTITFLKKFKDNLYYFNRCNNSNVSGSATSFANEGWVDKTATGISIYNHTSFCTAFNWKACGYLAEGEY